MTENPNEIVIFDIVKINNSFCARSRADRRRYEYLVPLAYLKPFKLIDNKEAVASFLREKGVEHLLNFSRSTSPLSTFRRNLAHLANSSWALVRNS